MAVRFTLFYHHGLMIQKIKKYGLIIKEVLSIVNNINGISKIEKMASSKYFSTKIISMEIR
jgi:hypothetical protein